MTVPKRFDTNIIEKSIPCKAERLSIITTPSKQYFFENQVEKQTGVCYNMLEIVRRNRTLCYQR